MLSPLNNEQTQIVVPATAAGTTNVNGSTVDLQGFDSVSFIVCFGTLTGGAVSGLKLQESDDGSTWADLAGTALAIADTDDNKSLRADLVQPRKRYARVVVTRGTANAVIDIGLAILRGAMKAPVSLSSTEAGRETHNGPVAGTA